MGNKKTGYIVNLNRVKQIAVVREDSTQTEFLIFSDELSGVDFSALKFNEYISFEHNKNYEQFVAMNVKVLSNSYGKVI